MELNRILEYANELEKELVELDFRNMGLTTIGESYYEFNIGKLKFNNRANAISLLRILEIVDKPVNELCIIDHGAGIGFFGLLAKKCGVGKILCHDISSDMIEDSRKISNKLNLAFDDYVTGDTDILLNYCLKTNLIVDGLSSRNVIEHIPDLNVFFSLLSKLPSRNLVLMITTSANVHNPAVHKLHKNIHNEYENVGAVTDMMRSKIETENSGRNVRKRIIQELISEISESDLEQCISNTRGLNLSEMKSFIEEFKKTGQVPMLKEKLSNTRDPYTGTWVERLVSYEDYKKIAETYGFRVESLAGFYNQNYRDPFLNVASGILNSIIKIVNPMHRFLSPFLAMRFIKKT